MDGTPVRTPCFDEHVACGGNMVDFHGFELPIWYSSIKEEHLATRAAAGLFDVSHMGSFRFSGDGVGEWLQGLATQAVSKIPVGRCAYTHFLDDEGHIIDDMIFAVVSSSEILGVPNASMIDVMWNWFTSHLPEDGSIKLENLSDEMSILALQGPASPVICAEVLGEQNVVGRFKWARLVGDSSFDGWIQGTGYTGESGYEIFVPNVQAADLWKELLQKGSAHGLVPVGLGARDTLRLEKGYLLSGQDFLSPGLGDAESPLPASFLARNTWETNVPFGLSLDHEFIGKEAVVMSSEDESTQRWWGLECLGRGPLPRPGKAVAAFDGEMPHPDDARVIGHITSGAPGPSLENQGIAMAYLSDVEEGDHVAIVASPRRCVEAVVRRPPFV